MGSSLFVHTIKALISDGKAKRHADRLIANMASRRPQVATVLLAVLLALGIGRAARADALPRLTTAKLQAVHDAIHALEGKRQEMSRPSPYQDYRAVIHLHSKFSHDSRGTIEEILAAAKATGTKVLMFTEHPSEAYDPVVNGYRGIKDGVLCIPGLETNGFLVFPTQSFKGVESRPPQAFADLALSKGSLLFLSHLEERLDWEIKGLTGTEIYNTHAQMLLDKKLRKSLSNPLWMFQSIGLFQKYPTESFGALLDYPRSTSRSGNRFTRSLPRPEWPPTTPIRTRALWSSFWPTTKFAWRTRWVRKSLRASWKCCRYSSRWLPARRPAIRSSRCGSIHIR